MLLPGLPGLRPTMELLCGSTAVRRIHSSAMRRHRPLFHPESYPVLPKDAMPLNLLHVQPRWPHVPVFALETRALPTCRSPPLLTAWARFCRLNQTLPFAMGFIVCATKGFISDTIAQKAIERRKKLDVRRVMAMTLFSGCFTGCAYHVIFNIAFTRMFGSAKNFSTVLIKAAADATVIFPFMYMPTYFTFDSALRSGTLDGIVSRWRAEIGASMREYMKIWPATMLCVFTVVPVELRVCFISSVSFAWLIILSLTTH